MNKSLKAKNLPLFSIIDLDQLRREKHLEGTEVTDFFTERDGKVYLLMEQHIILYSRVTKHRTNKLSIQNPS